MSITCWAYHPQWDKEAVILQLFFFLMTPERIAGEKKCCLHNHKKYVKKNLVLLDKTAIRKKRTVEIIDMLLLQKKSSFEGLVKPVQDGKKIASAQQQS